MLKVMKEGTFKQKPYGGPNKTDSTTLCPNVPLANIQINPQTAIRNLQNLKINIQNAPSRQKSLKFLYSDINDALGNGTKPSHYGEFITNQKDCTIRVSNHNAHASNYPTNDNTNISIKIRPNKNGNTFK